MKNTYALLGSITNTLYSGENISRYSVEIDKLARGLEKLGISYERKNLLDGEQIICGAWDAVCHSGSYGHADGLLEIMGIIVEVEDDEVEGFLTADEILSRIS